MSVCRNVSEVLSFKEWIHLETRAGKKLGFF